MSVARPSTLLAASLLLATACGSSRSSQPEQAADASCTRCHGDASRVIGGADPLVAVAPPAAASGNASDPTIGAHLAHLVDGPLSRAVACASCHVVPTSVETHSTGSRVAFSGLATRAWAGAPAIQPSYDRATLSCATTYCHGAFPNGNAANLPVWTGGAPACGSCHGLPPTTRSAGGTHPDVAAASCASCHDGYGASTVNVALHVNGQVDSTLGCTSCHGDAARTGTDADAVALAPAPPRDAAGSATGAAVGAHLRHLVSPRASRPVACAECHQGAIPSDVNHADGVTQVAFGPLARTSSGAAIAPAWDAATGCSATYCHGNFPNGLGANPVAWSGGALGCGSCHGVPPVTVAQGGTHPDVGATDCGRCHPGFTATTTAAAVHVNGLVELAFTCTSCHGDSRRTGTDAAGVAFAPAPPTDARGSASGAAVGAHQAHLVNLRFSKPVACAECHLVPTALDHADGNSQVAFGPLSRTVLFGAGGSINPVFDGGTVGCSATYCHGNFRNGLGANPVSWGGGDLICVSCHGMPPRTAAEGGTHPDDLRCGTCHPVNGLGLPVQATHVDGKVDFVP